MKERFIQLAQVIPEGVNTSFDIGGYGTNDPIEIVVNLLNWLLGIVALIAVVLIILAGFRWMTAGGNEEKTAAARSMLFSAIIGLIIVMAAWGIAQYVVGVLADVTGARTV